MDNEQSEGPRSASESPTFGQDGSFRVEKPVGSATISPCGRDVALASRQGLHIIDLDSPWSPPRHLVYNTPWEVADVQWSPFASRDYWVVSTSNQNALVWNLNLPSREAAVEHVLQAHTRAISDINFSAHYPDILATCAVDSFVHCWDLRHPARPALTFCDWFAGATQVKWNRTDPHILASSHDKFLRIWDDRKGATPLKSIEAHATKIYGVDWNRFKTTNLATCSLDKTVKFWDYSKEGSEPERVLQVPFPVWRARHTPFGEGLLAMPQRGDNDLHLYDCRKKETEAAGASALKSVHTFEGHHDHVKEFLWRPRGNVTATMDDREYQLVSWGADRVLRLHEVKENVLRMVGYHKGMEVKRTTGFTRKGAPYKTFRDSPISDDAGIFPDARFGLNTPQPGSTMRLPQVLGAGHSLGFTTATTATTTTTNVSSSRRKATIRKRSALETRRHFSQDMDPITWMRGVKIGKQLTSPPALHQSTSSVLSPNLKPQPIWDVYESLGEEIMTVGDKFSKIDFNEVDMQRRKVILSLSGPWGTEDTPTYLNVTITFPNSYPNGAGPIISIERTASLRNEVATQILEDIQVLTSAFVGQRRSSFETILRYLLGEQSLAEAMRTLQTYRNIEDAGLLTQTDDLSSSDDDDDDDDNNIRKYQDNRSDSAETIDPLLLIDNAQNNVPLPKACGALWANNGLLVCFFPLKHERETSVLDQSLRSSGAWHRNVVSEGFGKLHDYTSGRRKGTMSAMDSLEDGETDFDEYETSSSSETASSLSSSSPLLQHHFLPVMTWESNGLDKFHHHKLIPDGSLRSTGGELETAISPAAKAQNRVSLHNFEHLLPAQQCLAKEYEIGNEYGHALHNESVARKHGFTKLADAWNLIGLVLQDTVPLLAVHHPSFENSFINVARRATLKSWNAESEHDLSFDAGEEDETELPMGHVSWGSHPLGSKWLINKLFRYYEQQADVQMLAMMSCVFSTSQGKTIRREDDSQKSAFSSEQQLGRSSSYYPSLEVAISLTRTSIDSSPQKTLGTNSTTSSANASVSDHHLTISYENNAPLSRTSLGSKHFRRDSQTASLSTSPENYRRNHRSNSNLSLMAAPFTRPFSLSNSAASSPPNSFPKKRVSPSGSYLGTTPLSGISWASTSMFGKAPMLKEDSVTSNSFSASDVEYELAPRTDYDGITRVSGLTTILKNQRDFHDEGHAHIDLVESADAHRFAAFRQAYSELLFVWELPMTRCELLKYNDSTSSKAAGHDSDDSLQFSQGLDAERTSLALEIHCTFCAFVSEATRLTRRCPNCTRVLRPLSCFFCNTYIRGLASPCLHCGHSLHHSCRQVVNKAGIKECVAGCGCVCSDHPVIDVPLPATRGRRSDSVRDVSPAVTIIADAGAQEQETAAWKGSEWEEMAYESLTRNLRRERRGSEKVLKERVSQIWRGGLG